MEKVILYGRVLVYPSDRVVGCHGWTVHVTDREYRSLYMVREGLYGTDARTAEGARSRARRACKRLGLTEWSRIPRQSVAEERAVDAARKWLARREKEKREKQENRNA